MNMNIHRNRRLRVITISQLVGGRAYKTFNPGLSLSGTSLPCLENRLTGIPEWLKDLSLSKDRVLL